MDSHGLMEVHPVVLVILGSMERWGVLSSQLSMTWQVTVLGIVNIINIWTKGSWVGKSFQFLSSFVYIILYTIAILVSDWSLIGLLENSCLSNLKNNPIIIGSIISN